VPRYITSLAPLVIFVRFKVNPASLNRRKTVSTCCACSSTERVYTTRSTNH